MAPDGCIVLRGDQRWRIAGSPLEKVIDEFGLVTDEKSDLFGDVPKIEVTPALKAVLAENIPLALAIGTEKARSEMIVVPILIELRRLCDRQISLFSGMEFIVDADRGWRGLATICLPVLPNSFSFAPLSLPSLKRKKTTSSRLLGNVPPKWSPPASSTNGRTGPRVRCMAWLLPAAFGAPFR
jgi:hypothetical protein